jgi:hypothetical protein
MSTAEMFISRIHESFDVDQEEILGTFRANPDQMIRLINYYKGLPLSYPATIAAVGRSTLDLEVRAEQAYAIEKNRFAFIRSPLLRHDVLARVQYVNVKKQAVSFFKFSYGDIVAEQRNCIRMTIDPHPEAILNTPLGVVKGEVEDISITGVCILLHHSCPLDIGDEMGISFELKLAERSKALHVRVSGRLVSIKGDSLPRKYNFAISPDEDLERQLSQYIMQRQVEIVKEVKLAAY